MTATRAHFGTMNAATGLLGHQWTLLIIHHLHQAAPGRLRFCQLQARLGSPSPASLSRRLKHLEQAGLVQRVAVGSLSPHVEYGLTRAGTELGPAVESLDAWSRKWLQPDRPAATDG